MCEEANKIISSTFAATIMKVGYGIDVQESNDPYISMAEVAFTGASDAAVPGAFLVDLFPILKYVPSWFPGAGFQKKATVVREATNTMAEKPFRLVQEQLVYKFIFWEFMIFFEQWFYRKMAKLRRLWQQVSLSVFLTKVILKGPRKKGLRKMWLL